MPLFLPDLIEENRCVFLQDAPHLYKILRQQKGDVILVGDGQGNRLRCRLIHLSPTRVEGEILDSTPDQSEPVLKVTVCQALCRAPRLEAALQKCVELGAHAFWPVETRHCEWTAAKAREKLPRMQKIAREAAKHCGRAYVPKVYAPVPLEEVSFQGMDGIILPYEAEKRSTLRQALSVWSTPQQLALVIGPEGGFDREEIVQWKQRGAQVCTLGPRILRTETAAPAVLSALMYHYGEWGERI